MMSGSGGKVGPDLTNEYKRNRTNQWLIVQITNSKAHVPNSVMPDYSMLSKEQLNDLAEYLNSGHPEGVKTPADSAAASSAEAKILSDSLKRTKEAYTKMKLKKLGAPGEAASIIGNVVVGRRLFITNCASCHGLNGKGGEPNYGSKFGMVPALNPVNKALFSKDPKQFAENIDKFIQHGSTAPGDNPSLKMFDYGDSYSLTQPQIANIEAYILDLNHVNRAQIEAPNSAKMFSYITLVVYIVLMLLVIFFWQKTKRNKTVPEN